MQKKISSDWQFKRKFMIHTSVLTDFNLVELLWVTDTELNMCDMVWNKSQFMKGHSNFCKESKLGTAETVKTNGTKETMLDNSPMELLQSNTIFKHSLIFN
jgi:hypothetical protein